VLTPSTNYAPHVYTHLDAGKPLEPLSAKHLVGNPWCAVVCYNGR
jgi:hypothetical protein